jgi:hypothetical protein
LSARAHFSDYDEAATQRCERVLVTVLGDIGPWRERIYLAGGLAPRYLVGQLPEGSRAHVGTTDVDMVVGLALKPEEFEAYRTLQNNLEKSAFKQVEPSFRWERDVDGIRVRLEFLCETDQVEQGKIYRVREGTGSKFAAFNAKGADLGSNDFIERTIEAERLDSGGMSRVIVRVANLVPYMVMKTFAFQDRHENKDAYDAIFTLVNFQGGPEAAGLASMRSPISDHPTVAEAFKLLGERFIDQAQDGPKAYGAFLADIGDDEDRARLENEAVVAVRQFLARRRSGA